MTTTTKVCAAGLAFFCLAAFASQSASAAWRAASQHQSRPSMAKLFRTDLGHQLHGRGVPVPKVHHPRPSPKAIKVPHSYPHDPRYGPH